MIVILLTSRLFPELFDMNGVEKVEKIKKINYYYFIYFSSIF